MRKQRLRVLPIIAVFLLTLFTAAAQPREARVDSVDIIANENGVIAKVSGALPDGCSELGDFEQRVERSTILITLTITRQSGLVCTQQIQLFEENFPLDVSALIPGDYNVDVNGVRTSFTLTQAMIDGQAQATPAGTPTQEVEPTLPSSGGALSAYVNEVEIRFAETGGIDVPVTITAFNSCTSIMGFTQVNKGDQIEVRLLLPTAQESGCIAGEIELEGSVPIDVNGLAEGAYRVTVNTVSSPPFVLSSDVAPDESDCAFGLEGVGLFRNLRDGYCTLYPLDYKVWAIQPDQLIISASETFDEDLTIITEPAEGRPLDEITSELNLTLEEGTIGGEPALMTGALTDAAGTWQAFLLYDDTLYTFTAQPPDVTVAQALADTVISSFTFG